MPVAIGQQAGGLIFGDGSDGEADLDGTNTVTWASKNGSTYTMTRDAYLSQLTVDGSELKTSGFRLFVAGLLYFSNSGIISNDGTDGSDGQTGVHGTGGAGGAAGTLAGGEAGGNATEAPFS